MKEKPILFKGEMVRAILEGRKTQTRRIMKIQPPDDSYRFATLADTTASDRRKVIGKHHWMKLDGFKEVGSSPFFASPFGYTGDRLWVRETFGVGTRPCPFRGTIEGIEYQSDEAYLENDKDDLQLNKIEEFIEFSQLSDRQGWRPSIHMPRWASRITLEVTGVRVERLQSGGDREFWGEEKWAENPWVWVVDFKVVK